MNYKIWFDDELGVGRFKVFDTLTAEDVKEYILGLNKLLEGKEHCYILIDLTEYPSGLPGLTGSAARKVFKEYSHSVNWNKVAFFGAGPGTRMLAKTAIFALGKSNITKFFNTEGEAIAWLKEEK